MTGNSVIVTPSGQPAWQVAVQNNWYEASRWSPNRSFIWFPIQDARRDLDRYTRTELIRKSGYLWKNSPLTRGLIERLVNLTIGSGIHPVPISSDPNWNRKSKLYWRLVSKRPCVDSCMRMSQYQRIKGRERFLHGEGYSILTSDEFAADKIQGIEADRVTSAEAGITPYQKDGREGPGNDDGILLNGRGLPVGYQVRGVKEPFPSEFMIHHVTFVRSGQKHGEPILAAAINTAHDVDDILAFEKQAVKEASSHKDIIKTPSGEYDPEQMRKFAMGTTGFQTPLSVPKDDQSRSDYYRVHFGSEPVVLRSGDEYTPYKPDRPGAAWQGFMAFLSQTVCLSAGGLPPSLVLPVDVGGTDIRRDLELAQRIVEPWQGDIAEEWQAIWEFFMGGAIEDGALANPPADWKDVRWHFPKSITVDRGRDAQQDRSDVMSGLMSHEEYHGRYGDHAEEVDEAIEMEVRKRRFRLFGTDIDEPFEDVAEFVSILSLDSKLFINAITAAEDPEAQSGFGKGVEPGPVHKKPSRQPA